MRENFDQRGNSSCGVQAIVLYPWPVDSGNSDGLAALLLALLAALAQVILSNFPAP